MRNVSPSGLMSMKARLQWLACPGAKIRILVFESASLNGSSIGNLQANKCLIIFFDSRRFVSRKQINRPIP